MTDTKHPEALRLAALYDADRAMRAQAAPAAVASPLTKLQRKAIAVCFTSDKVSVSEVQRKLSISYADAQTLCQSIVDLGLTDELELAPSLKQRGAPAPQHIESAALLALGLLWMTERDNAKVQTAFKTLRDALGSKDALRKGIEAAIEAGYEADHPPGADWWAGKKERHHD